MLPEIKKILYSTDLSKNASFAFQHATYLAQQTGADIHILHVVEKLSGDAKLTLNTYVLDTKRRQEILHERLRHARAFLDERQAYFWEEIAPEAQAVRQQIKSIDVCESYPTEEIIKKSKELGCDLIVMGTHEKGRFHTFLGSVAKSVIRQSRIPVLVVPLPQKD